ncbi:MAG TPA: 3-phosphoserine/phosphohydroxythreonine transaminase [Gemmatimonadales bacterium]|nr:3-phosphoserine/phosphohydroxythreonine transaminase [Gemmatimonadales bacterium]
MSDRIWNFCAGPAVMPESVLKQAQQDIWNVAGSGIGILEHSHRGKVFDKILDETFATCRRLAGIPDDYEVLFVQGGASLQFSMVPMNLLPAGRTADYLVTGVWSEKAVKEAQLLGTVHEAASGKGSKFTRIPEQGEIKYSTNPAYVHFTSNNTIYGTQWRHEPGTPAGVPLICDASSDIFSQPIDIRKYGMIYAGAQKNLGPSGIVLIIVRKDLIELAPKNLPTMLQYRTYAADKSMYNTPPTFAIYAVGQVLKWIEQTGGLKAMAARNEAKAGLLYDALDASRMFKVPADKASRSLMNVCFRGPSEEIESRFIAEATKRGLDGLKGHRNAGGMRASIYNAMPQAGVEALVSFIREFESSHKP